MLQTFALAAAEASTSSEISTNNAGLSSSDIGAIVLTAVIFITLFFVIREVLVEKRGR